MENPGSILVVKPSSLGDIVHTLPAVRLLRRHWPHSRISWVANSEWMPLLNDNPHIDTVLEFPRKQLRGARSIPGMARFVKALRQRGPHDLALDFQGLLRSGLICAASGARSIIGMSDAREGARHFFHTSVDVSGEFHAVDRCLALARAVAGPGGEVVFDLPEGEPVPEMMDREFVAFHPFSRGKGKSLDAGWVTAMCAALAPCSVVLLGFTGVELEVPENAVNLLNRTSLSQLIWLLRRARFTISVDSGPAHIAAALGDNMLAIHSWSDPAKVGPYNPNAMVWQDGKITRAGSLPPVCLPSGLPGKQDIEAIAELANRHPPV